MRIRDWHEKRLKENADYAAAHAEIAFAQSLADLLVGRRVALGLSQMELADRAGTTQATISHIENGEGNPRLDTLARILAVLSEGGHSAFLPYIASAFASIAADMHCKGPFVAPHHGFTTHIQASGTEGRLEAAETQWQKAGNAPVEVLEPIAA